MLALMMDRALNLSSILEYAAAYHGDREVVTRTVEGPIHRYTYADALVRAKQMAKALTALGVKRGDRVATLAWSTHRHFELYYAVSGIGAVSRAVLRFFNFATKGYVDQPFEAQMELSNLTGNIARKGDQIILHAHATLGRSDYTALAGHLSAATIHGAGEFFVIVSDVPVFKVHNDALGLDLYDLA